MTDSHECTRHANAPTLFLCPECHAEDEAHFARQLAAARSAAACASEIEKQARAEERAAIVTVLHERLREFARRAVSPSWLMFQDWIDEIERSAQEGSDDV